MELYWIVIGRVAFDDEDSILTVTGQTELEATEHFEEWMQEQRDCDDDDELEIYIINVIKVTGNNIKIEIQE